jgi:hypothetical protein
MNFVFTRKAKNFTFALMALGAILLAVGLITDHSGHTDQRFWSGMLINSFFFFAIALGAVFYMHLHYATESGWGVVLKRVFEGVMSFLPIGSALLLIVVLGGVFGGHHIWHWMDEHLYHHDSAHYDELIAGKAPFFYFTSEGGGFPTFFVLRTVIYLATFIIFWRNFRKRSLEEDLQGGTALHIKNYKRGALFLVFFAVFSSTMVWDWIMSIDTHWFSTLFGWYVFSGMWVSAMVFVLILTLYLKSRGYLKEVNESHIHDLGKWVFALSFLWSYLWFSQFMLIWYSDIPEETTYFHQRFSDPHYNAVFFSMFAINFIMPMILLMSREAKRAAGTLIFVGLIIFVGHWLDVFMLVTPGTMFDHGGLSALEIGMFILFLGGFIFYVLHYLTKAPLMVKNHPYLEESMHHEI